MTAPELPELLELHQLAELAGPRMTRRLLCEIDADGRRFPVEAFMLGSASPTRRRSDSSAACTAWSASAPR